MPYFQRKIGETEDGLKGNFNFMASIHECRRNSLSISLARFILTHPTFGFIYSFIRSRIWQTEWLCFEDRPQKIRSLLKPPIQPFMINHLGSLTLRANDTQNHRWLTLSKFWFQFENENQYGSHEACYTLAPLLFAGCKRLFLLTSLTNWVLTKHRNDHIK